LSLNAKEFIPFLYLNVEETNLKRFLRALIRSFQQKKRIITPRKGIKIKCKMANPDIKVVKSTN